MESDVRETNPDASDQSVDLPRRLESIAGSDLRVLALQASLALIVYAVVISGPLVFDDYQFIAWNEHVTQFDLAQIYTSSVTEGAGFQSNTYRPNQQLVFALLYKLFGTTPHPYHVFSVLIHVANAFMVFALLRALSWGGAGGLLASLVFLLHPVQTQAVSYVSGLAGPLGLMFVLGAIHAWMASLRAESSARRYGLLVLSLALSIEALFSKSNMVIIFPCVLLLTAYFVITGRETLRAYVVGSVAAFGVLAFGYLALKLTVLNFAGGMGMIEGYNVYTDSLFVRLSTFVSVLDRYLELLVWPASLSYSKPRIIYANPYSIHGVAGGAILAVGLLALVRARKWPVFFLACGWFFAAIAPFCGVIPLTSMYLEHWLYAPLVGVAIGIAAIYDRAGDELRSKIATVAIVVLLAFMIRTTARNYDWADPVRFYVAEMRVGGYSVQMLNNLATWQMEIGKDDDAITTLEFLIGGLDNSPEPHDNLARIHLKRGDLTKAREEFLRALEFDPNNRNALMGLRGLYDDLGQTREALKIEQRIRTIERDEGL